ncbi:MAG: hypothetical protein RL217_970 [Pseudomonadota bacterium]
MSNDQHQDHEDFEDESAEKSAKVKGRSQDYEQKRRRAEKILEQARLKNLLGYDIDLDD